MKLNNLGLHKFYDKSLMSTKTLKINGRELNDILNDKTRI